MNKQINRETVINYKDNFGVKQSCTWGEVVEYDLGGKDDNYHLVVEVTPGMTYERYDTMMDAGEDPEELFVAQLEKEMSEGNYANLARLMDVQNVQSINIEE